MIGDCPAAYNHSGSTGPWQLLEPSGSSTFEAKTTCAGGAGDWIGFSAPDLLPGDWGFRASTLGTDLTITEARVWLRAYGSTQNPSRGTDQSRSDLEIVDQDDDGFSTTTAGGTFDASVTPLDVRFPQADAVTSVTIDQHCLPVQNDFYCPISPGNPSYDGQPIALQIFGAQLTILDNQPPVAGVTGGSLDGPGPVTGPAQLAFQATDAGAGIAQAELLVNGQPVTTHSYSASCTYTRLQPCPGSDSDQLTWNSGTVAPGQYQVALSVTDAAGNTTISSPHEVTVLAPIGPNGIPCAGPTIALSVAGQSHPPPIHYGQTPTVRGVLHCGATPIPGATVDIGTANVNTARPLARVRTDSGGSFSYRLARGASRRLTFSYTAYSDDPAPSATSSMAIAIIPHIALRISPRRTHNNGTITWRGEVSGGPYPPGGLSLQVQVREDRRWVTFDDLVTRNGRFAYRYTFDRTTRPTIYTFRISLPYGGSVGYPYRWAASRKIAIHVA